MVRTPLTGCGCPTRPRSSEPTHHTLTLEEVHQLLGTLDGQHHLDAAVEILFTVRLRASEVLGLAWDDLNLDTGDAVIRRAATHVTGKGVVIDTPKTVTGANPSVVHLSPTVIELLIERRGVQAEQRDVLGPAWQTSRYEGHELDLVFTAGDGRPVPRQALHRAVRDACIRAGIDTEGIGTHTGRRTVVSLAYQSGVDIADVARLGRTRTNLDHRRLPHRPRTPPRRGRREGRRPTRSRHRLIAASRALSPRPMGMK